jgi:flagellar biosynthesis/type III secretory pathway M-ring protein FliF/YscJ
MKAQLKHRTTLPEKKEEVKKVKKIMRMMIVSALLLLLLMSVMIVMIIKRRTGKRREEEKKMVARATEQREPNRVVEPNRAEAARPPFDCRFKSGPRPASDDQLPVRLPLDHFHCSSCSN